MTTEFFRKVSLFEFMSSAFPEAEDLLKRSPALTQEAIEGAWPPLRTISELNRQIPQIDQLTQELFHALRALKMPDGSWAEALETANWRVVYDENDQFYDSIKLKGVQGLLDSVRRFGELCLSNHSSFEYHAWWDAQTCFWNAASWEILKDQLGDSNPFLPLAKLYELGATAINFYLVNGEEKLVIDFPLKGKFQGEVACLAFGDGEPGDKRVLYVHPKAEPCTETRHKSVPRRVITKPPYPED
jgi:hypothetical protein